MNQLRFYLIAVFAVILGACAIPIQPAIERPPLVEPLKLTMGKCFGPAITKYEYRGKEAKSLWIFPVGPPSVQMFNLVFTGMFVKTGPMENCPPKTGKGLDFDAIIETQIERFWWYRKPSRAVQFVTDHRFAVEITYRFLLFSPKGETLHSWAVMGSGLYLPHNKDTDLNPEPTWFSEAVKLAMRDAAAKFVANFRNQPKIQKWLQGLKVSSRAKQ